jgi:asparagine synthase (glutamine-hydrolysing)
MSGRDSSRPDSIHLMSRIAGIVSNRNPQENSRIVSDMLMAMGLGASGELATDSRIPVALGWTGRSGGVFFPHRSLSRCDDPAVAVVFDGCIYNRADFNDGARARKSDAELLAELYLQNGLESALKQINGDFALALYDFRSDALWIARDRLGVKPLYCFGTPDAFAFASEPGALVAVPGASREPNRKFVALFAASHYRYFDNDPGASPYQDIAQLPAGSFLRWRDGKTTQGQYWRLTDQPDYEANEGELAARYRELLLDAVRVRIERSGKPAFTLSGGMDSSSVLASAVRLGGKRLPAFSSVYSDKTFDETQEIQSMVEAAAEPWTPVKIAPADLFAVIGQMVAAHHEPVATATWLSHYQLCREVAERGYKSLFGGLGGDELNAGEYEYYFFHFADLRAAGLEKELRGEVELWARHHDHPIYRKNYSVMEDGLKRMVDLARPGICLAEPRRLTRYYAALEPDYFDLKNFAATMEHPFQSYLKNRAFQDLTRETTPCCLRAEDRQTSAFGLDHFDPFLDYRLVEFMFRVPGRHKIRDGVTKRLLREAMKGILPEETRARIKKTGWNAPAHVWFAVEHREPLLDLVRSRRFRERGIYRVDEVERIVAEHRDIVVSGRHEENHMMFLWQLVNLELWFRAWVDEGGREQKNFRNDLAAHPARVSTGGD